MASIRTTQPQEEAMSFDDYTTIRTETRLSRFLEGDKVVLSDEVAPANLAGSPGLILDPGHGRRSVLVGFAENSTVAQRFGTTEVRVPKRLVDHAA
jgi:hypothetical protein